jgi:two-component system sensor histidine kinase TctE
MTHGTVTTMQGASGLWDVLARLLKRMGLGSLRAQMVACLLGPILLISVISNLLAYYDTRDKATAVVDQMLVGSARMIGGAVSVRDGFHSVEIPPAAIENLGSKAGDTIYFRVDSPRYGLIAGTPELPAYAAPKLSKEGWFSFNESFRGQDIRVVAFAQPVFPFAEDDFVIIQVATTLKGRDIKVMNGWERIGRHQVLLLVVAALLGMFWTRAALAPVLRIGDAVSQRQVDDRAGIDAEDTPAELTPLVESINEHIQRINHYINQHDRFISNAAHQLKTPLTVLNTQISVGLRSAKAPDKQRAMSAAHETLRHCIHMTEQLLTLCAADHITGSRPPATTIKLNEIVRTVLENHAELADMKHIDLGFAAVGDAAVVSGVPILVETLAANLLDNAIRYTPPGGVVTATVKATSEGGILEVEDNGPGIPPPERDLVLERYYRRTEPGEQKGCGLGLSIVREIALGARARLELLSRTDGQAGLLVRVTFPAPAADAVDSAT